MGATTRVEASFETKKVGKTELRRAYCDEIESFRFPPRRVKYRSVRVGCRTPCSGFLADPFCGAGLKQRPGNHGKGNFILAIEFSISFFFNRSKSSYKLKDKYSAKLCNF